MKRTLVIFGREYHLRLRKPSFWVLAALVPLVLAALYALPVAAARHSAEPATVLVVDETGLFDGGLAGNDQVHFRSVPSLDEAEHMQAGNRNDIILYVPLRETTIPHDAFLYYRRSEPPAAVQNLVAHQLQQLLRNAVLEDVYQLEPSVYHSVEATRIALHTQDSTTGRESYARIKTVVAAVLAVLLVLALLFYGVQVMRAVQEERQNRTAELMATSVRPVQLLTGKLTAIAAAGLTQLALWLVLASAAIQGVQAAEPQLFADARALQEVRSLATKGEQATAQYDTTVQLVDETVQGLTAIRLPLVATVFVLCFLLGYMFYGALLAALAARLDSDTDALPWALTVMSPLLAVLALLPVIAAHPSGTLATVLTLVPFTAPATALVRLPFGLPVATAAAAAGLAILSVAAATLLAAHLYRRRLTS